eukprot:gene32662-41536_t
MDAAPAPGLAPAGVVGLTAPTPGTKHEMVTVLGNDKVVHHVYTHCSSPFNGAPMPVILDLATTHSLREMQVLSMLHEYWTDPVLGPPQRSVDLRIPMARRLLTQVQPGWEEGFASLWEIENYLAEAGLEIRDVNKADGDCWLRAICPYIDGMHRLTRNGIEYHVMKLREATRAFLEQHRAQLFPWHDAASPATLGRKKAGSENECIYAGACGHDQTGDSVLPDYSSSRHSEYAE